MTFTWAYIFHHPGADPVAQRTVIDQHGMRTLLVPVSEAADAPLTARHLVDDDGARLIELCGAFTIAQVNAVVEVLGVDAAVGHTTFDRQAVAMLGVATASLGGQ